MLLDATLSPLLGEDFKLPPPHPPFLASFLFYLEQTSCGTKGKIGVSKIGDSSEICLSSF